MATTNYSWNLPTVGGSEDTWGTQLNANWMAIDTLLGGVTALEFSRLDGVSGNIQTQIDSKQAADAELTALAALTPLEGRFIVGNGTTWVAENGSTALASLGITVTTTEINYLSGASGNIQNQIDSIVSGGGANNSTITITAGAALTGGGSFTLNQATEATVTVAHGDTSSQSSVNNSGLTFIQDITLDTYGHITNINSATVSIAPTTTQVLDATAGASLGAVGTYAFAATSGEGGFAAGRTVSGSNLQYAGGGNDSNSGNSSIFERSGTLSGTWRQMGYQKSYQADVKATLWLRIS
jgi:hypothetical protein